MERRVCYTLQALWTMAREQLDVTIVVCANQIYRILRAELRRAGVTDLGATAASMTDLSSPELDWTHFARGLGVPAVRVQSADALCSELARGLAEPGPRLIEALLLK